MRGVVERGTATPVVADLVFGACVAVGLLAAAVAGVGPGTLASARSLDVGAVAVVAVVAAAVAERRRYPVAAVVALNAACLVWISWAS